MSADPSRYEVQHTRRGASHDNLSMKMFGKKSHIASEAFIFKCGHFNPGPGKILYLGYLEQ